MFFDWHQHLDWWVAFLGSKSSAKTSWRVVKSVNCQLENFRQALGPWKVWKPSPWIKTSQSDPMDLMNRFDSPISRTSRYLVSCTTFTSREKVRASTVNATFDQTMTQVTHSHFVDSDDTFIPQLHLFANSKFACRWVTGSILIASTCPSLNWCLGCLRCGLKLHRFIFNKFMQKVPDAHRISSQPNRMKSWWKFTSKFAWQNQLSL